MAAAALGESCEFLAYYFFFGCFFLAIVRVLSERERDGAVGAGAEQCTAGAQIEIHKQNGKACEKPAQSRETKTNLAEKPENSPMPAGESEGAGAAGVAEWEDGGCLLANTESGLTESG